MEKVHNFFFDQQVKGQGQICTLNSALFLYAIMFWRIVMILDTCVAHDPRQTPIDFGVKRSRSNLYFELNTFPQQGSSIIFWNPGDLGKL